MSVQITSTTPFTPAAGYPDVDIKFRVSHQTMMVSQKPAIGRVCVLDVGTTGLDPVTSQPTNLGWMILDIDQDYGISQAWGPYLCTFDAFGSGGSGHGFDRSTAFCGSGIVRPSVIASTPSDFLNHIQHCQLIISHHADFDETMLRKAVPSLPDTCRLPWACTVRDMPWNDLAKGYGCGFIRFKSLSDLIGLYGYYHQAHDTAEDAFALSWLLSQPHNGQGMLMQHLIKALEAPKVMITITDKPKPAERRNLGCRGYKFNYIGVSGGTACMGQWSRVLPKATLPTEQHWLSQAVRVPYTVSELQVEPVFRQQGQPQIPNAQVIPVAQAADPRGF